MHVEKNKLSIYMTKEGVDEKAIIRDNGMMKVLGK